MYVEFLWILLGGCLVTEATLQGQPAELQVRPSRLELVATPGACAEGRLMLDGPAVLLDIGAQLEQGSLELPAVEEVDYRGDLDLPVSWCPTADHPTLYGMIFLVFEDADTVFVPVEGGAS